MEELSVSSEIQIREQKSRDNRRAKLKINRQSVGHTRILPTSPFYSMTRNGYVSLHRLTYAQHIGRPLSSDEIVVAKDKNYSNTNIDNLILYTQRGYVLVKRRALLLKTIDKLNKELLHIEDRISREGVLV